MVFQRIAIVGPPTANFRSSAASGFDLEGYDDTSKSAYASYQSQNHGIPRFNNGFPWTRPGRWVARHRAPFGLRIRAAGSILPDLLVPVFIATYYVYTYNACGISVSPFLGNCAMVNITLSAEEGLVARARAYAQTRNTTVNQLIRDYLTRVTGQIDPQQAAAEFAELARDRGGRSDEGFVFDRRDVHVRAKDVSR
jgi:hypothetical protein